MTWKQAALTDLCEETETWSPSSQPRLKLSYVDVSAVASDLCKIVNAQGYSGKDAPGRARKIIKAGDTIFATIRPSLRRIAFVPRELDGEIASTAFCVLRPKTDLLDPHFLYFAVRDDSFVQAVAQHERGSSYPAVRDRDILGENIPFPPLKEQRQIAFVLSQIQQAIEVQTDLIRVSRELKAAVMNQLFSRGLRGEPQKETEIGLVPESWAIHSLGAISKIGNGSTPRRTNTAYWKDGSVPWLTSGKIHERVISHADELVSQIAVSECHLPTVAKDSLLVAITGQGKTLGNTALVTINTCISQHLAYITFTNSAVDPWFMLYFLQGKYQELRSIAQAGGSTKAALTCGFLKGYKVPVPQIDEQMNVAARLRPMDESIKLHEAKLELLSELFAITLKQLMAAEIRVTDLNLNLTAPASTASPQGAAA